MVSFQLEFDKDYNVSVYEHEYHFFNNPHLSGLDSLLILASGQYGLGLISVQVIEQPHS